MATEFRITPEPMDQGDFTRADDADKTVFETDTQILHNKKRQRTRNEEITDTSQTELVPLQETLKDSRKNKSRFQPLQPQAKPVSDYLDSSIQSPTPIKSASASNAKDKSILKQQSNKKDYSPVPSPQVTFAEPNRQSDSPSTLFKEAQRLFDQGSYDQCIVILNRCIEADETADGDTRYLIMRSNCYEKLGDYLSAADDRQRAVDLKPLNSDDVAISNRGLFETIMGYFRTHGADLN